MENKNSNDPMPGRWELVCWECNLPGGWTLHNTIKAQCFWTFREDGKLIEEEHGCPDSETSFVHIPEKRQLHINRSNGTETDSYRIEVVDDSMLRLYDLENVVVEPDDYVFRLIIRKNDQP